MGHLVTAAAYARALDGDSTEPRFDQVDTLVDGLRVGAWRAALADLVEVMACKAFVIGADLAAAIRGES